MEQANLLSMCFIEGVNCLRCRLNHDLAVLLGEVGLCLRGEVICRTSQKSATRGSQSLERRLLANRRASVGRIAGMMTSSGHKKLQHLIEAEAYRRIMAGEAPATLVVFAQQLLDWLRQSYPDASPTTPAMVENQIRETWHRRHDMIHGGGL